MLSLSNNQDSIIKEKINYIYKFLDLKQYNYDMLNSQQQLNLLDNMTHLSVNFAGTRCFLIFNKLSDNKYYSYLINRKTLTYNNITNYNDIEIINISISLNINTYNGSIFDGIYIKGKSINTFVITDVFYLDGEKQTTPIFNKLNDLSNYLSKSYKKGITSNNIELTINKLYNITNINDVINKEMKYITNYPKNGICFYPKYSGKKIIYLFDKINKFNNSSSNDNNNSSNYTLPNNTTTNNTTTTNTISNQNNNINIDNVNENQKIIYIPNDNKTRIFEIKKNLEKPDIYYIYCIDEYNNKLIRKKIDTCLVDSINESLRYNSLFDKNDTLFCECEFILKKNKWKIIKPVISDKPCSINSMDKKIITVQKYFLF